MWKVLRDTPDKKIYKRPQIKPQLRKNKVFVANTVGATGMVQIQERKGNSIETQLNFQFLNTMPTVGHEAAKEWQH